MFQIPIIVIPVLSVISVIRSCAPENVWTAKTRKPEPCSIDRPVPNIGAHLVGAATHRPGQRWSGGEECGPSRHRLPRPGPGGRRLVTPGVSLGRVSESAGHLSALASGWRWPGPGPSSEVSGEHDRRDMGVWHVTCVATEVPLMWWWGSRLAVSWVSSCEVITGVKREHLVTSTQSHPPQPSPL